MYSVFEDLLKYRHVTIADVCKATGIGYSTISNWKKRRNLLSPKYARLIADYFGVSLDYLMTGEGDSTMAIPGDRAADEITKIIRDNPIIVEMIYDFQDIDESRYQRLRGYYDAIVRNERRQP